MGALAMTSRDSNPVAVAPIEQTQIPGNEVSNLAQQLADPGKPIGVATQIASAPAGSCLIKIIGKKPKAGPLAIAIFSHPTGIRVDAGEIDRLPKTLEFERLPVGNYQIVLARSLECARLSYLRRHALTITKGDSAEIQLSTDTNKLSVTLALAKGSDQHSPRSSVAGIPVFLHRVDDPRWRYRRPYSANAEETIVRSNAAGRVHFEDLGPGQYRLEMHGFDPIEADKSRLTFQIRSFDASRPIRGLAY